MTTGQPRVAVVRASSRRVAVTEALALLSEDVRRVVPDGGTVLIKPNLVSHKVQLPSTHADTLSAALGAVFSAGARDVVVAEGASDATAGFRRFGFHQVAEGRPVRFVDLNREETEWHPLELLGVDGSTRTARVSRTIHDATCRVSLALAKTHVTSIVTLSLKNMLSSIHPQDRVMMHGFPGGGNGYQGWKRLVVEFLKGDNALVRALTRSQGLVNRWRNRRWESRFRDSDPFRALSEKDLNYLRSVVTISRNLVRLGEAVRPHLSVVDGFVGMHGEGPRHGSPIRLRTVIAGTDPVAVDAVSAAVMGFDPMEIGHIALADAAGLGVGDLDRITVVGDPVDVVRQRCTPHSNIRVQRQWRRLMPGQVPTPHFARTLSEAPRAVER